MVEELLYHLPTIIFHLPHGRILVGMPSLQRPTALVSGLPLSQYRRVHLG